MNASFRCLAIASFFSLLSVSSAAQQQNLSSEPVKSEQRAVNIKSNEVLLDVIVHDKKGRLVRDLKPEEIEVFEDGIKQTITQFRLIDPGSNSANKKAVQEAATSKEGDEQVLNPPRPVNLATMVFDNFDPGRVQTARTAALNFVDNSLAENTLVRIFVIKRKLYLPIPSESSKS
jgi:VWFA-related protein